MLEPGSCIGSYRIVRLIGRGGIGVVYEAIHEHLGQRVALKVLDQAWTSDRDVVRRSLNEARALAHLDHPAIVKVIECGRSQDGAVYLAMEYLVGETLHARLERMVGRLPVQEALRLCRQLAQALRAAHDKGIIHRDMKPGNVFLVQTEHGGCVKLLDFGLAKLLDRSGLLETDPAFRTQAGLVLGTPSYMSPEQCLAREVNEKTDVYSLGVLLYRTVTGRLPFVSNAHTEVMAMHVTHRPRPIREIEPSLPESLSGLVEAMLLKEPQLRPAMGQVIQRLKQIEEQENADRTIFKDEPSVLQLASGPHEVLEAAQRADAPQGGRQKWMRRAASGVILLALLGLVLGIALGKSP